MSCDQDRKEAANSSKIRSQITVFFPIGEGELKQTHDWKNLENRTPEPISIRTEPDSPELEKQFRRGRNTAAEIKTDKNKNNDTDGTNLKTATDRQRCR